MVAGRTSSRVTGGRRTTAVRGTLRGCALGFLISTLVLLFLVFRSPFFADSVKLALLLIVVPLGVLGGLVGLTVGATLGSFGRGGARRSGAAARSRSAAPATSS